MRLGAAPNLRVQDGLKQHLLCDDCEGRLAVWEKHTAESVFSPYHRDTSAVLHYGPWFSRFCASVLWRVLFVFQAVGLSNLAANQVRMVEGALRKWSDFMFDRVTNPGSCELHVLPVDVLQSARGAQLPANVNRYLARAVEMDVPATSRSVVVYVKMCKLIVVGLIQSPPGRQWRGSRVGIERGVLRPGIFEAPRNFGDYLWDRATRMAELQRGLSARQKGKIDESLRADLDRAAQSETFKAMAYDVGMFGDAAFDGDA